DNPVIYFEPCDDGEARIDLLVKGAGSENNCIAFSLTPKEGVEGLISAVVGHVAKYGGASCPPLIVGVGIGGTLDYAVHLSKRVLFAPINEGGEASELEEKLQREIDRLGIGVMGLGEGPTVMKVKIAYAGCHTASLPVAINIQCWALRRRSLVFNEKGEFTLW
ncbi:MAG TPA: fumarate hydratase, partial [Candidatus Methanomethylia archaeon]|nr:fumarate hydratase [Candidatus Methanomethylicia archaeon]